MSDLRREGDLSPNGIEKIVTRLNQEIFDSSRVHEDESYEYFLELSSDGFCVSIKFMDVTLWCSEEDNRDYDEDNGIYEPLCVYLKREALKVCSNVAKVSSALMK